jgi:predicted alpha-1,2-mannosidase
MHERTTFKSEFGLVELTDGIGQLMKVNMIHLGRESNDIFTTPNMKPEKRILRLGLNSFLLPIRKLESEQRVRCTIQVDSQKAKTYSLLVKPASNLGYVPADKEHESVSKTLEYAFDDWCIAQMAKSLGKNDDYELFSKRANNFKNLFDTTTGFMRGKNIDGKFVESFNPIFGTQKQPEYTEGNAWQYTWSVQHDPGALVSLMGGKVPFSLKLDTLFSMSVNLEGTGNTADVSGLIGLYAHGNEPSHHIAYLYNYADQNSKTQRIVRKIMDEFYTNTPEGLIGNEDCGQMSAWFLFSALGFYPVNPASGKYDIGTPLFEKATLHIGGNRSFTVLAKNINSQNTLSSSVKLNGVPLRDLFITHEDILKGGVLEFQMGR